MVYFLLLITAAVTMQLTTILVKYIKDYYWCQQLCECITKQRRWILIRPEAIKTRRSNIQIRSNTILSMEKDNWYEDDNFQSSKIIFF